MLVSTGVVILLIVFGIFLTLGIISIITQERFYCIFGAFLAFAVSFSFLCSSIFGTEREELISSRIIETLDLPSENISFLVSDMKQEPIARIIKEDNRGIEQIIETSEYEVLYYPSETKQCRVEIYSTEVIKKVGIFIDNNPIETITYKIYLPQSE